MTDKKLTSAADALVGALLLDALLTAAKERPAPPKELADLIASLGKPNFAKKPDAVTAPTSIKELLERFRVGTKEDAGTPTLDALLAGLRESVKEAEREAEESEGNEKKLCDALAALLKSFAMREEDPQPVERHYAVVSGTKLKLVGAAAVNAIGGAQAIDQRLMRLLPEGNYVFLVQKLED